MDRRRHDRARSVGEARALRLRWSGLLLTPWWRKAPRAAKCRELVDRFGPESPADLTRTAQLRSFPLPLPQPPRTLCCSRPDLRLGRRWAPGTRTVCPEATRALLWRLRRVCDAECGWPGLHERQM